MALPRYGAKAVKGRQCSSRLARPEGHPPPAPPSRADMTHIRYATPSHTTNGSISSASPVYYFE